MSVNYKIKRILEQLHLSAEHNAGRSAFKNRSINPKGLDIKKIENHLELISLHVPKSAGTSFYKILQGAYGKRLVARVDSKPYLNGLLVNKRHYTKEALPEQIKVIHGHIRHKALKKYINLSDNVKIITWLRNPVERIISDYFYVKSMLNERYRFDPYNPHVLDRITKSLTEFAATKKEQNRISKFLGDIQPEDLYFIGIMEHFEEDMESLARMLNWKSYTMANINKTKNKSHDIPAAIVDQIKELNRRDMDLYEKALSLRTRRIKNYNND